MRRRSKESFRVGNLGFRVSNRKQSKRRGTIERAGQGRAGNK